MTKLVLLICGLVAFAMTHAQPDEKWKWSDHESNILAYVMRGSEKYDITLTRSAKDFKRRSVSISAGGKTIFEWETHEEGTFAFSGDLLIYSNHSRIANFSVETPTTHIDPAKLVWGPEKDGLQAAIDLGGDAGVGGTVRGKIVGLPGAGVQRD